MVKVFIKYRRPKSLLLPRYRRNMPDAFISLAPFEMMDKNTYEAWVGGDEDARREAFELMRNAGYPTEIELMFQKNKGGGRPRKFSRKCAGKREGFVTFDKGRLGDY